MSEERLLNPVQVRYSDDGSFIYVSVNPREVIAAQLAAEDILEALIETGYSSFEYQLEQKSLDELTSLPWKRLNRVIIRRIAYRVEFDLKVILSPDRMSASVTVTPAYADERISRERLLSRLSHAGVKLGLIDEAIEQVIALGEVQQFEIARGKEPEHGGDSWLEILYPLFGLSQLPLVEAGAPLVRRHPPTPGVDGYRVTGQVLPARGGQVLALIAGEGCDFAPKDPNLVIASDAGLPILNGLHVRIDRLEEAPADALAPFYLHSLRITGDPPPGTKVRTAGHLIVTGTVSGGEFVAEADLVVQGPVQGPVWLQSAGDMHLDAVRHALIHCGRTLRVAGKLTHCQAYVARHVQAEAARVRGGALHCLQTAVLGEVGSPFGDETLLQLGVSNYFLEHLFSLQAEGKDLRHQLEALLRKLIRQRSAAGESPETQAVQLQQRALLYRDHSLKAETETLAKVLDPEIQLGVTILGTLHAGTRVCVQDQELTPESMHGVRFGCAPGQALVHERLNPPDQPEDEGWI